MPCLFFGSHSPNPLVNESTADERTKADEWSRPARLLVIKLEGLLHSAQVGGSFCNKIFSILM